MSRFNFVAGISGLFEVNVSVVAKDRDAALLKIKENIKKHTIVSVVDSDMVLSCNLKEDLIDIGELSQLDENLESLYSKKVQDRYAFLNIDDENNNEKQYEDDDDEDEIPTRPDTPISLYTMPKIKI